VIVTVRQWSKNRLDLLPSTLELAWSLKQPAQKEQLLAKFLDKVQQDYDLILIDCAPTESVLTTAAYLSSNYVLVPVKPEFLSTIGLPLLARSLDEFHEQYDDHHVDMLGVVFNHATQYEPEEALSKREVRTETGRFGWYVFSSEISYSRSYPKGAREGQPIFRTSHARYHQTARFSAFAQEFGKRVGL
jgi:chromosome partitioning protein